MVLGRDQSCDIVLDDASISPRHLAIEAHGQRYQLMDLGSERGTWVRGRQVVAAEVGLWELIRIGARVVRIGQVLSESRMAAPALVIGRDPDVDIVLDHTSVSRQHARLNLRGERFWLTDLNSRFGSAVDGESVSGRAEITAESALTLGRREVPQEQLAEWLDRLRALLPSEDDTTSQVLIPEDGSVLIGRSPDADLVLDDPQVSWEHARIDASGGTWQITDLRSRNGTFVGGRQIRQAPLSPDDQLALGPVLLSLRGGRICRSDLDPTEVRLDCADVERTLPSGARLLDRVSFTAFPGELVAVMGPSGCGKTTLLSVLSGRTTPSAGQVRLNGRPLHGHFEQFRQRIGLVSQHDVMHTELTVGEVIWHTAQLRLPSDLPRSVIRNQVDRILEQMGLTEIADHRIGDARQRGISGGQRRRVSIAMELVTDPAVLFLDEPTSGLDASSALEIVQILQRLAVSGKTILLTIHQPRVEVFGMLDRLLLLARGGRLVWFGPADPEASDHLAEQSQRPRTGNPADFILDVVEGEQTPEAWQALWDESTARQLYVDAWREETSALEGFGSAQLRSRSAWSELGILTRRGLLRKARDRATLAVQLLQAPIIAGLAGLLFDKEPDFGLGLPRLCVLSDVLPALFMLGSAALWFGCSNVARELVGDRPMFHRERLSGLSVRAYLGAVFTVQFALAAAQVLLLVLIAWPLIGLSWATFGPAWVLLLTTSACSIGLGLLLSSLARTEVAAISLVPLVLLPLLMLSGYLKLYRELGALAQALTWGNPMRWIFEGLVSLEYAAAGKPDVVGECLGFTGAGMGQPMAFLSVGTVTLLGLTLWRLTSTTRGPRARSTSKQGAKAQSSEST